MRRNDVSPPLRGHERELKALGVRRLAVFGLVARGIGFTTGLSHK
jgi:hypothetical protein